MEREWVKDFAKNFSSAAIGEMSMSKLVDAKTLNTPNRLFKIRTYNEFSLKNLVEKTLHLSVASQFNDP